MEADKTRTRLAYEADGGVKTETTLPNGETIKTNRSADGKHSVTETPDSVRVEENRDEAGRLTSLAVNERPVLQQEWHANGLLKSMSL
jgi:YD repeat-containing protein